VIGKTVRPASLFAFAFFKEVASIADPVLDSVDGLLDDRGLLALSTRALTSRSPGYGKVGRAGIAPDRLLRCAVLEHIKGWSYRELHRELRVSLLYRRFTRFYEDPIPDFSNLGRAFALFGKEGTEQIHQRIVQQAKEATIIAGKKLRTDNTAVETNIHHPTDSSLLADSVRVMSRYLQRIAGGCQDSDLRIVNHARAVKHRVLELGRAARSCTQAGQEQLKQSYKKLIGLTQGARTQGVSVLTAIKNGQLVARQETFLKVLATEASLKDYLPLVEKVIAQSQARIFQAQTRHPEKILSLFEPTVWSFARVKLTNPMNLVAWSGSTKSKTGWSAIMLWPRATFAISHSGCRRWKHMWSYSVERQNWLRLTEASGVVPTKRLRLELGVKQVVLPSCGRLSAARAARQKQRWFRRGQGWRAGIKARLSTLKLFRHAASLLQG
jgi:transposase, IS5 family